jgi:hypothetical protein
MSIASAAPAAPADVPPDGGPVVAWHDPSGFNARFRREVTGLVDEVLRRRYVTGRAATQVSAMYAGRTPERQVAEEIVALVMARVDAEYF